MRGERPRSGFVRGAIVLAVTLAVLLVSANAWADGVEVTPEATAQARVEFARGNELGKNEDWAEALSAFLRSYALRPHPTTAYNVGTCLRVLGRYAAARAKFAEVLVPGSVEQLPATLAESARGFKDELDRLIAHVTITIDPVEAEIAVDGRPLQKTERRGEGGMPVAIAGILASGPGTAPPARTFEMEVDPGTRVIVLSRKGYRDIVRPDRFAPGSRTALRLDLEQLPATLRITSNVEKPVVTVNGVDVGMAPVDVPRAAGVYKVVVAKDGYVPHAMVIRVNPGEDPKLDASLVVEKVPITKRWWFWVGAAVIVATGVAVTYAVTRPDPQPPDYERGNTGWLVQLGQ
jgi:PEGA domain